MAKAKKQNVKAGESKPAKHPPRSVPKRIAFAVLAVSLILIFLEGLLSVVWVAIDLGSVLGKGPRVEILREEYHCEYDKELGWVNRPGVKLDGFYGKGRSISINANGLRGQTDLSGERPASTFRTVCLGDSFTLGYGVDDPDTFPHQLQRLAGLGHETANMGQGGYSVGQSYLWLKRLGPELKPDLVVCVFIVEDFRRLLVQRTANGFATPQFSVEGSQLVVSGIPVAEKLSKGSLLLRQGEVAGAMQKSSALIRTLGKLIPSSPTPGDEEAMFIGLHILKEIATVCREIECPVVLILTPTLPELFDAPAISRYEGVSRVLAQFADQESIPYSDLRPAFMNEENHSDLFLDEAFFHYSPSGNAIVARELHEWLPLIVPSFLKP